MKTSDTPKSLLFIGLCLGHFLSKTYCQHFEGIWILDICQIDIKPISKTQPMFGAMCSMTFGIIGDYSLYTNEPFEEEKRIHCFIICFEMLSSVTINCQVTKIVVNLGSQLSAL